MKKRVLSILLVVVMMAAFAVIPASAVSQVLISVEKAVPGYPVSVTVDGETATAETEVLWYVADTETGEYTAVSGASGNDWQITNSCAKKFIKAEVDGVQSNSIKVGAGLTGEGTSIVSNVATAKQTQYMFRISGSTENAAAYYQVLDSEIVDGKKQYLILRAGQSTASGNVGKTGTVKWEPDADPSTNKTMAYWLEHYWYEGVSTPDAWKGAPTNGQPPINATNNATLDSSIKPYVVEHTWLTANNNKTVLNDYTFKAHATVMSSTEFRKYANKLYINAKVMLRNGRKDNSNAFQYYNYDTKYFNAMSPQARTYYVFPIFYVTEDLFKNVKFDLTATGADVKALIAEHNDYESLINIGYGETEIEELGVIREEPEIPVEPSAITISVEKAVPGYPVEVKVDSAAVTTQTVTWHMSDTEDGAYTLIDGATSDGWQITNACANKYIKADVDGTKSNAIKVGAKMSTNTSWQHGAASEKPSQYSFRVSGSTEDATLYYQLLDSEDVNGKKQYFVLQVGSVLNGKICTDSTNVKWDPTLNTDSVKHVAYWLENYWSKGLTTTEVWTGYSASNKVMEEALRAYVPERTWLTERSAAVSNDYTFKARAAILSISEVRAYKSKLYKTDIDKMFMRNGHIADTTKKRAYSYVNTRNIACIAPNTSMASTKVLPAFYLTEDFFKNVKLDLNATGAEVLSQLAELNTIDELASIGYTQKEIAVILNGVNEFYLADSTGSELPEATVESEDNKLYLKASITNRLLDKQGVMLAVARYKDDYLDKIVHNTFDIESGETLEVAKGNENEMSIDIDEGENVKYKIFVWDSLTNAPITESKEYKDMKKIIFIGNSYTFYGMAVINAGQNLDDDSMMLRQGDEGYFYQLSKQNNADFHVTNWTWGGHNLKDIFGESCAAGRGHDGHNHLADFKRLLDTEYDYVVMQPTPSREITEEVLKEDIQLVKDAFSTESPDAKYILLLPAGYYFNDTTAKKEFRKCLATIEEDAGVTLVDWGNLISDLINGTAIVEDTEIDYNKNTFIVSASSGDGYHQNQLSGYITAQFVFSTLTGKKAEGENYAFCTDDTIHPSFSVEKYLANYYLYDNISTDGNLKGDDLTTYPEIFKSPTDMLGIQKLIDKYIEEKPYMNE